MEKIPSVVNKTVYLLSGALIPVWRQVKNVKDSALKIVRTTTDEGVRLVGLQVPKTAIKEIVRLFDVVWTQEETSHEILEAVLHGKESIELSENIRLRSARFFGSTYVEVVPGRAEHPKKFRSIGLTSLTQQSRERFLLPEKEDESVSLLKKLITEFPPVSGANQTITRIDQNLGKNISLEKAGEDNSPINVCEWITEPDSQEYALVCTRDLLNPAQ